MDIKDFNRTDWKRITKRQTVSRDTVHNGLRAKEGLILLQEITAPLVIHYDFAPLTIIDKDYAWLQIGLEGAFVWLSAVYDDHGTLVQVYFDITAGNAFDNPDNPIFRDMYLDIVLAADGQMRILDQDELDDALENGEITKMEYDYTKTVCHRLYDYLLDNKQTVMDYCDRAYRELIDLL